MRKSLKFFEGFGSKSLGKRYENALKTRFLHRKSYFLSAKYPNFRACGAATLPVTPQKIRACGAATTQTIIQNVSHVIQKVIIQKYWWRSKSNYSKAIIQKDWWRSKAIIQKLLSKKIDNVQKQLFKKPIIQKLFMKRLLPKQFSNLHAAIALSTHAQNVFYKPWLAR